MRNSVTVAILIIVLFSIVLLNCCVFSGTKALPVLTQPSAVPSEQLPQYILDLINKDRTDNRLATVTIGNNNAAQGQAFDMLANFYLSHWGADGLKPYMRYTLAGGINYETENSAYHGWYDISQYHDRYVTIDPKEVLKQLQYNMMFDDADSNWGHRDIILNKLNKKVNIGIAYDKH